MKLGKVIGTVVSTQKVESFEGVKLLLVQPLDENYAEKGEPLAACDTVQAGVGDIVLYEGAGKRPWRWKTGTTRRTRR